MTEWTKDWPQKPGVYWFYGWPFKDRERPTKIHFVEVRKISNGMIYVTNGHFLYKTEGADGYWCEAYPPEPPKI